MWALFCACLAQPQPEVASECDYGDPTSPLEWIDLRRWTEEPPPSLKTGIGNWTNVTNLHSQHAIAKLGAVREGVLRRFAADPALRARFEERKAHFLRFMQPTR